MKCRILFVAAAIAFASENYIGVWKIESATVAPWWTGKAAPDRGFVNELAGKRISFTARSILAPRPLACASPRYALVDSPVEGLFQGNLANDKAESIGFRGAKTWRTLQTGCEGGIDFHFLDAQTATFALDNHIYRIRKQ